MKTFLFFLLLLSFEICSAQVIDSLAIELCKHKSNSDPWEYRSMTIDSISNHKVIRSLEKNVVQGNFVNHLLTSYFYNQNSLIDSIIYQHWNGNSWNNDSMDERTYDVNGKMTSRVTPYYNYQYFYDNSGNDTLTIYQVWNGGWQNNMKWIKAFDTFNNKTSLLVQTWTSGNWINNKKEDYTYNLNQHLVLKYAYSWDNINALWVDSMKYDSYQDAFDNDTSIIRSDWIANTWQQVEKDSFVYDNWNHPTMHAICSFDGSSWFIIYQEGLSYDSVGHFTGWSVQCCGGQAEANQYYIYNSDGSQIYYYSFNMNQGGFTNTSTCQYYSIDFPDSSQLYFFFFGDNFISKCSNDSAQIDYFTIGGVSPLHYQWTPSTYLSSDTVPNPYFSSPVSMWYTLTVTDDSGFIHTQNIGVSVSPTATILSTPSAICDTSPVTLIVDIHGSGGFDWYKDGNYFAFGASDSLDVYDPGGYFIIVYGNNGCIFTSEIITVTDLTPQFTTSINPPSSIGACDASVTVNPVNGVNPTILWTSGDTVFTITGLCSGTYYFTLTDTSNCQHSDSVLVSDPPDGIYPTGLQSELTVSPNPFTDMVYFDLNEKLSEQKTELVITDAFGKIVYDKFLQSKKTAIDKSSFTPGIFSYKLFSEDMLVSRGNLIFIE